MSRKNLRSQLDELRREKEQLESENTRLKAARDEEAGQLAELKNLRKENERLVKETRRRSSSARELKSRLTPHSTNNVSCMKIFSGSWQRP